MRSRRELQNRPRHARRNDSQSQTPVSAEARSRRRRTLYLLATAAVAILIITVAVVLRGVSDMKGYNRYMLQAQQSYGRGENDLALAALRKAAAIDKSEDCLLLMVSCYENQGNYIKALEILRGMDTKKPEISSRISAIESQRQLMAEAGSLTIAGRKFPVTSTSLVLEDLELTDTVFSEIGKLYALESLSLANNSLSNISALSSMGGLVSLNLSGNDISDVLPLASLVGLRTLNLDNNSITDFSPLCCLPNLTSLSIKGMEVSPAQLEALSKALPNCAIHSDAETGENQDISFGGVTFKADVTELDLSGMGVRDISVLSACTKLKKLNLSGNEISDLSPLMNLPELEWLDISGNQVTDLRNLMGMERLSYVNASSNSISSTAALSMMNGLKELYLDNNPISDFSGLRKVKSLERLGLSGTGLDDEDLSCLYKLTLLTALDIRDNGQLTGEAVDKLQAQLATCNISRSELAYNIDVDGQSVLSNAVEVELSSSGISDISGLSKLDRMEKLDLSNNNISNIYIFQLTNSRFTIKELNLAGNQIEDITPLASLQNVEVLDLSNNMISSELPLMNLKKLKTLYLGGNLLSDMQIDSLQNSLLDCEIILD